MIKSTKRVFFSFFSSFLFRKLISSNERDKTFQTLLSTMSRKLLRTESMMSREDAAQKLHDLADKIGDGRVELKAGEDSIELRPSDQVEFEIEVEEETDGDISIEMEVEWSEESQGENLEIN